MPDIDPLALTRHVLWLAFAFGGLFGVVAQRTHFCTMGAVADIVSMGDWTRLRMWVLAIAVAVLGFNAMVGLGWVQAGKTLYATPRLAWLSLVVGGALFGFGMVIASGCGSRNLVRLGGGNLKSLVVLIVLGLAGFATLKGITGSLRVATVDQVAVTLPTGQDLPSLLSATAGTSAQTLAWWLGTAVAVLLVAWVLWRPEGRRAPVWLGGLGVGAVVVGLWWVSGTVGHLAEDPRTLEEAFLATNSHRMESLSTVSPIAYGLDWLLYFSDASQTLSFGIVTMLGIVLGAAASALASRSFRLEGFGNASDLAHHLVGATLMGVGGVTALGCSIGQGLSGVSTLSVGSMLALAAIIGGTWLGLRYQEWRL